MNLKSFTIGLSFACTLVAFGVGYWVGQRNANASLKHFNETLLDMNFRQARRVVDMERQGAVAKPFGQEDPL